MKVLTTFDMFVLVMNERLSHKFERLTGVNCFALSKICFSAVCGILIFITLGISFKNIILNIFIIFIFIFTITSIKKIESEWKENSQFLNKARFNAFPARMISWLLLIVLSASDIYFIAIAIFLTLSFYLASCTPLPKNKSKIRKWVESRLEELKTKQVQPV